MLPEVVLELRSNFEASLYGIFVCKDKDALAMLG